MFQPLHPATGASSLIDHVIAVREEPDVHLDFYQQDVTKGMQLFLTAAKALELRCSLLLSWVSIRLLSWSTSSQHGPFPTLHFCRSCSALHQHPLLDALPRRQPCAQHQHLLLSTSLQLPQCLMLLQRPSSSTLRLCLRCRAQRLRCRAQCLQCRTQLLSHFWGTCQPSPCRESLAS